MLELLVNPHSLELRRQAALLLRIVASSPSRQLCMLDALFGLLDLTVVAHGPCNAGGLAAFRHTMEYWVLAVA